MLINKEQFREFEWDRLLFMAPPDGPPKGPGPTPDEVKAAMEAADAAFDARQRETDEAGETEPKSEEKAKKDEEEAEDQGDTNVDAKEKELNELINRAGTSPELAKVSKALYDDPPTRFKLAKFMNIPDAEASAMTQEQFTEALGKNPDLKKVVQQIDNPEFKLDKAGKEQLGKAIDGASGLDKISKADATEVKLLMETDLGKLGKEGLTLLSMTHEIRRPEKKRRGVEINIDGTWTTVDKKTIDAVVKTLPPELQGLYSAKTPEDGKEHLKKVVEKINGYRSAMELRDALVSGEALPKGADKMALVTLAMQLLPMLRAIMDGDMNAMKDAIDGYKHWKETGEFPMEAMKNARDYYAGEVKNMKLGEMLAFHANPRSAEADQRFYTPAGPKKFRGKLAEAIQERMALVLGGGTKIAKMQTGAEGGGTDLIVHRGGREFDIYLMPGPGDIHKLSITEISGLKEGQAPTNFDENIIVTPPSTIEEEFTAFRAKKPATPPPATA